MGWWHRPPRFPQEPKGRSAMDPVNDRGRLPACHGHGSIRSTRFPQPANWQILMRRNNMLRTMELHMLWLVAFLSVVSLGACEGRPPDTTGRIAATSPPCEEERTTPTAAAGQFETVRLVLELCIDGGTHDLSHIGSLLPLTGGRVAVLQRTQQRVRVFSEEGDSVASVGRQGQGPGEFENPTQLGSLGDTLWVYDSGNRHFTLISSELSYIGRIPQPATMFPAVGSYLLEEGAALFPRSDDHGRLLVRVDANGRTTHVVSRLPFRDAEEVGRAGAIPPLPNDALWAVAADGSLVAALEPHLSGSEAGTTHVSLLTNAGDTVYSSSIPFEWVEIPTRMRDSLIADRRARARSRSDEDARTAGERAARVPRAYPPLREVVLGSDASLWLRGTGLLRDRGYLHVAPGGAPVARVPLPRSATILAADSGRIWTSELDAYGVPSVARYRVIWQPEGGQENGRTVEAP